MDVAVSRRLYQMDYFLDVQPAVVVAADRMCQKDYFQDAQPAVVVVAEY
jgi:hypothetical protein